MAYSFNKLLSSILPAGTYKVVVDDAKFKTGKMGEESNDILVVFKVIEGPYAKRNVLHTIYEKAFSFRLPGFLKAAKVDMGREFTTAKELYSYGIKEAKGKVMQIEVGVRTYNGNDYNDVLKFIPTTSSTTTVEDVTKQFGNIDLRQTLNKVADNSDDSSDVEISADDLPF
jgi:hypothetical protein